jgi:outer membrane lipoprotein carrier protein
MLRFAAVTLRLATVALMLGAGVAGAADAGAAVHGAAAQAAASAAGPADTTLLGRYLMGLTSLRADFTQTVTDAHGTVVDSGGGSLALLRPGRFRWDYQPKTPGSAGQGGAAAAGSAGSTGGEGSSGSGELLVADGRNLWYYDRELAQVTVKPLQAGQSVTPIMLLTGSSSQLNRYFEVMADGTEQGLSWVLVKPRSDQAGFSDARLGFRGQTLSRMVFHDMVGQTVQLDFSEGARNVPLDPSAFEFKVPPGVDVIGTPQSTSP